MIEKINQIKNDFIPNNIIQIVKALILDINIFIIILKKNSSFVVNDINLLNVLSFRNEIKTKDEFIGLYNRYFQKIKLINNSFDGGFKHKFYTRKIRYVLPIKEKNIILILLNRDELRIYKYNDIKDNNYYLSKDLDIIYHVVIELYNIDNKIILIEERERKPYVYDTHGYNHLSFIEIVYDRNNKPIDIKPLDKEKYEDISELNKKYYSFDLLDKKKMIFTDKNNIAYVIHKNNDNNFFLYKTFDIVKSYHDSKNENQILCDKYNNNIIILYKIKNNKDKYICFNIYDLDYNPKKMIKYKREAEDEFTNYLKILNKDFYFYFCLKTILIISSKYLEIVSAYKINDINIEHRYYRYCWYKIFVLNNANRIFICTDNLFIIYKFYQNELIYVGKKPMNYNDIKDIKEINDKGDHIIVLETTLDFEIGKKEILRLSYIKNINNENDKIIKNDYSLFKFKSFDYNSHDLDYWKKLYYDDSPANLFHCSLCYEQYLELCLEPHFDVYNQEFIYRDKKEDRHCLKKKYNNKKKRRYINFRFFSKKKQYRKYKSNKRSLNKYEIEDFEEIYSADGEKYFY